MRKISGTILVIDDDMITAKIVAGYLHNQDIDIITASDGPSGLQMVKTCRPDLILLDIQMPQMDGYKVCRQLKSDPKTAAIPVIFLTAVDAAQDKVRGFAVGATDYITKPFHGPELCARVLNTLKTQILLNELDYQAHFDSLTGLANRDVFNERLFHALRRSATDPDYLFAVLFLDYDHFKLVNDSLGHQVGDEVLVNLASRLREKLQMPKEASNDDKVLMARLGGDEFVVFLDDIRNKSEAENVALVLQQTIAQPCSVGSQELTASASIGIVICDNHYERPDQVLRDADTAMYDAKAHGRAKHVIFTNEMHDRVVKRLALETELRLAVPEKQLFLCYQPIYCLSTGDLKGFEALVRWNHPKRGLVNPIDFIPIAEETGLIVPIGEWVLHEACQKLSQWHNDIPYANHLTMNVNLSRRQLVHPPLLKRIREILDVTQVDPSLVVMEITESVIMDKYDMVVPVMEQIRAMNMPIAMDDFGTGYSSLSCLNKFPLQTLKIDRSFVDNLDKDKGFSALLFAITSLAHNLNLKVVAEGIETKSQLAYLQALDCDFGQGYYFAKPLVAKDAEKLLQETFVDHSLLGQFT